MTRFLLFIIVTQIPTFVNAQNNAWVFCHNCGIYFNSSGIISTGYLQPYYINEACISVSDSDTGLLFYSDGRNIYNKLNQVMDQGWAIRSNTSTAQGMSYKKLDSTYYLFFSLDHGGSNGAITWGLIDMKPNGGLGKVIKKNQSLADSLTEGQAILELKSSSFLITKNRKNTSFELFEINSFNRAVNFSKTIPYISFPFINPSSCLKISPNGKILATTNYVLKNLELFCITENPFDIKYFGAVNNFDVDISEVVGCEFSPDCTKLYVSSANYLYQYDLSKKNIDSISDSKVKLYGPLNLSTDAFTIPQLGPDKKIYIKEGYSGNISVINTPNASGFNCQFQFNGLNIPNCDYIGNLPYFQTYSLNEDTLFQMTLPCKDPEDSGYFEMPNVFTPNGDGINDTLMAFTKNTTDFTFYLYNRWGELVFESHTPEFKWDGNSNGQPCSTGAYYALLHYTLNRKEASSSKIIQLIR